MTRFDFIDKPLTIKEPPDFTVVSTFAGCGGSSTGYVWAGGKVLLAVEWDDNAVETYRLNYPDTPIYHGDIAGLSVDECLELADVQPGELDIFDGSPPCQGFSTAGKRNLDDSRNQLFREYVRLLRGLKPKTFIMENVPGMVKGKMKLVFAEVMRELKASGYQVRCQKLNAMYFGVPQSRERLIFIGMRDDLGIVPTFPKGQTRPIPAGCITDAPKDNGKQRFLRLEGKTSELIKLLKPHERMASLHQRLKGRKAYFAFSRLHPDKVARTIVKDSAGLIHFYEDRAITVGEMMRIGSFPDEYQFNGSYNSVNSRIGNSVPPRFMQAIAEHVRDCILGVEGQRSIAHES